MKLSLSSGQARTATGPARVAVGVAILLALGELIDAFFIDYPAAAVLMAALFIAGALWSRRAGIGGLVFIAFLLAVEIVFIPTYGRSSAGDWIAQILIGIVAAIGLVASVAAIRERRSRRRLVEAAPPGAQAAP